MLQALIDQVPELASWSPNWLLANLTFAEEIEAVGGPGIPLALTIVNDGYAESTPCEVVARVSEIERGNDPHGPWAIRYRHPEQTRHLEALAPGDTQTVDFGAFPNASGAPDVIACVIIDPPTDTNPIGQVHEISKQDNILCLEYRWGPIQQEDPPSKLEPAIEDRRGPDTRRYRLHRRIEKSCIG